MALRVLLADDSSDIRKSITVALQDYGADVRAVTDGTDVISVCREIYPDIIFCDTVLPKKDGFAVCREIKADPELSTIPVVLIYSGFVGLQKEKSLEAQPDATLEKPFEAEQLRQLVKKLVTKTHSQKVSEFLTFPSLGPIGQTTPKESSFKSDSFEFSETFAKNIGSSLSSSAASVLTLDEEPEEFAQVPISSSPKSYSSYLESSEFEIPDDIQVNDLSDVKVVEAEDLDEKPSSPIAAYEDEDDFEIGGLELKKPTPKIGKTAQSEPLHRESLQKRIERVASETSKSVSQEVISHSKKENIIPQNEHVQSSPSVNSSLLQLDPKQIEKLVENHIKQAIEGALWKILPDIAERVIREEIERLMREAERET